MSIWTRGSHRIEVALWVAGAVGAALAIVGWRTSSRASSPVPSLGVAPAAIVIDPDTVSRAASHLSETDPFRLDRRPARVAYQAVADGAASEAAIVRPPRPTLVLKGIIGAGRPARWVALIDGVPGRAQTAVVRDGDTLGGLRVRHVGRDTVVVTASDTTWRLTVRLAWQ
jgi:hypothetical protein